MIDPIGNTVPALTSPSSPWCYLWIDPDAPFEPTVTSSNYTSGRARANPVGTPGSFTFTDPSNLDPGLGLNDVAGYYYGIDDARPATYVQAQYEGGPATITLVPFTSAEEDLYVAAVDEARQHRLCQRPVPHRHDGDGEHRHPRLVEAQQQRHRYGHHSRHAQCQRQRRVVRLSWPRRPKVRPNITARWR